MNYVELLENARKNIGPYCKACPVCNGLACKNQIPGPGAKGSGDNAIRNYKAWQNYRLVQDPISDVKEIDTSSDFFGYKLKSPIVAGPVGAVKSHYGTLYDDLEYNQILLKGCKDAGIIGFTGDGKNKAVLEGACKAISSLDGIGVPTIKPWDMNTIFEKLDLVKSANPKAIAMDIDAGGLPFLKNQNPPAGVKTVDELKEIINYAKKPFIIKGIMSLASAKKAYEAGASAIVISNHGGRVLDSSLSTLSALEEIAPVMKNKLILIVDGGIRSGADVFKALALGADLVLIARPFVVSVYGGKEEGISLLTNKITEELKDAMLLCGAHNLKEIDKSMIKKEIL